MKSLTQIQRDVEVVLEYSQEYPFSLDARDLVAQWYKAKTPYIDLFGGETRIKLVDEPISIELQPKERERLFDAFMNELEDQDEDFLSLKARNNNDLDFNTFLRENKEGFFDNRVVNDYPSLKAPCGTKLLKCFKHFIRDFDYCRMVQDIASRYIQGTKISGILYISVDPLDYLTASENNCCWRTCHSLDGEYRAGNVNYMVDETTLVAYLASEQDQQLQCFPEGFKWNSKKWRMLIHTNNFQSIIYYNRQYPFDSDALLEKVHASLNLLLDRRRTDSPGFFSVNKWSSFNKVKIPAGRIVSLEWSKIIGSFNRVYDTRDIIDESESLGYTDLCYSPHYSPIFSFRPDKWNKYYAVASEAKTQQEEDDAFHKVFDITIGRKFQCLKCGRADVKRSQSFLCDRCIAEEDMDEDAFPSCVYCGRRLYPGMTTFQSSEGPICETCYDADNSEVEDDRYRVAAQHRPAILTTND